MEVFPTVFFHSKCYLHSKKKKNAVESTLTHRDLIGQGVGAADLSVSSGTQPLHHHGLAYSRQLSHPQLAQLSGTQPLHHHGLAYSGQLSHPQLAQLSGTQPLHHRGLAYSGQLSHPQLGQLSGTQPLHHRGLAYSGQLSHPQLGQLSGTQPLHHRGLAYSGQLSHPQLGQLSGTQPLHHRGLAYSGQLSHPQLGQLSGTQPLHHRGLAYSGQLSHPQLGQLSGTQPLHHHGLAYSRSCHTHSWPSYQGLSHCITTAWLTLAAVTPTAGPAIRDSATASPRPGLLSQLSHPQLAQLSGTQQCLPGHFLLPHTPQPILLLRFPRTHETCFETSLNFSHSYFFLPVSLYSLLMSIPNLDPINH
ncbi:uncharacterized protein LOC126061591 [Elephas maximus indicus]|uniref:uncharacterized protein LOC126061591 n=1 Tax=Elephas maximus indicus TaxID=99487 RepID=UPI002117137A|nr:uncharacterized protein LOC126061591 [Elephas maximus indicus]XP_049714151.1 uncharacterized protein LOC126061591 [Elephas maximus indicus]XP_049714152.1 uncharacterized protein LOC126061591 [Elephas maximus indicus]XP_049714153.1 uncharacterized protein LOC126061591 [Elephas maximus indicus]XP_049714154.1 uncharacterized protein LOC126061591 [Elephas maximus indicus]XP_049714156.1 uncharacterized protein LOC126061591 [Elephas maximus indicus]XP_049714157.1 uncharacterized protein LOC12606